MFLAVLLLLTVLLIVALLLLRAYRRRVRRLAPAPAERGLADPWKEAANRVQPFKQE